MPAVPSDPLAAPRKPYRSPELVVYGDIREITGALLTPKGAADGKGGGTLKTGAFG